MAKNNQQSLTLEDGNDLLDALGVKVPYIHRSKDELKELCRKRGIYFKSNFSKDTLAQLLESNDQETALPATTLPAFPKINRPLDGAEGDPPPPEVEQEEAVNPEVSPEVSPEATPEVSPEVSPVGSPVVSPVGRPRATIGVEPPASPMSSVPSVGFTWSEGPNSAFLSELQYHKYLQSTYEGNRDAILRDLMTKQVIIVEGGWTVDELWSQMFNVLNCTYAKAKAQAEAQAKAQAEAQAKAQAEAQAKAKAQAEAQAKAQAEAQAKAQADAQAKAQAEAQAKAQAEAQAKAQAEAQAEAQAPAPAVEAAPASKPELKPQPELRLEREVLWGVSPRALIVIIALVLTFALAVVGLVMWDRAQERAVAAQLTQGVIDALESIGKQK